MWSGFSGCSALWSRESLYLQMISSGPFFWVGGSNHVPFDRMFRSWEAASPSSVFNPFQHIGASKDLWYWVWQFLLMFCGLPLNAPDHILSYSLKGKAKMSIYFFCYLVWKTNSFTVVEPPEIWKTFKIWKNTLQTHFIFFIWNW